MDAADPRHMLSFHRFLLGQTRTRLDKFRQAITERVRPGAVVLDLGTGSGVLAFFACLAGARRVYAVERGAVIELAKLLARENGFEERIVFLGQSSLQVDLAERADVLITDTFGLCGLQPGGLGSLIDARNRLLGPGGHVIPSAIELFVAPLEAPEVYKEHIDFWSQRRYGIDLSAGRQFALNTNYPVRVEPQALLGEAASVTRIDLSGVKTCAFHGEIRLTARRAGTFHGLCVWFVSDLIDGVTLTNEPGAPTTNYAQGFFPVARPARLDEGDRITVRISCFDSIHWRWQVDVDPRAGTQGRARFDHSTFWGSPISEASLRKRGSDYTPKLSPRGEAEYFLLGLSNGGMPIAELERMLVQRYPDLFKSPEDVTAFVADVITRCA